jgi:pimeloyl-ACP methyl ester carboxylesterase
MGARYPHTILKEMGMAELPAGPYRTLRRDGTEAPYYIIPFDKNGRTEGPQTRAHLVNAVRNGQFTDIFMFSHGWNNDWTVATKRYEDFMNGYIAMRRRHGLAVANPYAPLLVGIFWPSTALTFGEGEEGPKIAAGNPEAIDRAVAEERKAVREIAEQLPEGSVERFYELSQKESLTEEEALELARIVQPFYASGSDEGPETGKSTPGEIVGAWQAMSPEPDNLDEIGTVNAPAGGPQAAGFVDVFKKLDPRNIIRTLTVRQMKDRAGVVGARGVGPLLRDLMSADKDSPNPARLHLIGHSYGAKVMLSAIAAGGDPPRAVHSLLLLQPAVSHLCFADLVPETNRAGGYRAVLGRVKTPILTTFSAHDFPLTQVFHFALRRSEEDLGEGPQLAGAGDPPSIYAALGGFGPRAAGEKLVDIQDVNQVYGELGANIPIIGLRSTRTISGHGDISNESTWWALYSLASR